MKDTADRTGRFPALDQLGAEFLRVARAESLSRRRLRLRRLALALAVTLIAVPAGFALADDDGSDPGAVAGGSEVRPIPEGFLDPPFFSTYLKPLLNVPAIAARLEAIGYEGVASMSESEFAELDPRAFLADLKAASDAYRDYLREHPEEIKDVNVIGSGVLAAVQECRANPNPDPHGWCGIALAKADGKLPDGRYTDAELQAAVRAAGYEWRPSD